jgi:hypothetical protein
MSDFELPSKKPTSKAAVLADKSEAKKPEEAAPEAETAEKKPEAKYSQDELLRIFDEVIFSGEYCEDVTIKNRLKVRFRTRTAEEIEEITRLVDATQANWQSTVNEKRTLLNLQYALISFQGTDLRSLKIDDRAKYIRKLPGPVIGALLVALGRFDEKVFAACQEGEENF